MDDFPDIPGYRLTEKIHSGGFALVYSGIEEKTGEPIALKILKPSLTRELTTCRRFVNEMEIISNLDHPNIVRILKTGSLKNLIYLVMEYLPENLKKRIQGGKISPDSVSFHLQTIKQVALALEYAHGKGIIHRDIKSENIMFRSDGVPVLVDFGLAKIADSLKKFTRSDMTVGTPDYMSPEQIQGMTLDCRSDIYSLGVVFFEMLTGTLPYRASNYIALAMKHVKKKVPRLPRKLRFLQPLVNQMMTKDRDKRISNAAQLVTLLNNQLEKTVF